MLYNPWKMTSMLQVAEVHMNVMLMVISICLYLMLVFLNYYKKKVGNKNGGCCNVLTSMECFRLATTRRIMQCISFMKSWALIQIGLVSCNLKKLHH